MDRRTYRAATMTDALAAVKRALGPHAIIVSSRTIPAQPGGEKACVEIVATSAPVHASHTPALRERVKSATTESHSTAGPVTAEQVREILAPAPRKWTPPSAPSEGQVIRSTTRTPVRRSPTAIANATAPAALVAPIAPQVRHAPPVAAPPAGKPPALPAVLQDLYTRLVQNEVAAELAQRLVRQVERDSSVDSADGTKAAAIALPDRLRNLIRDLLPPVGAIAFTAGQPQRIAVVGPPGSGKTTAIAKLAAHFTLREQRRVALLSLDAQRMAAHEQLGRYAEIVGVPLHAAQSVSQVHDILHKLDADLLLIDTPGVAPREEARFVRLAALLRATRPHEVHLALSASLSRPTQLATTQRFAPLRVSHLMLTRLDEAVGLGVLLTTLDRLQWRLSYVTSGQRVPADIEPADRDRLADLILAPA